MLIEDKDGQKLLVCSGYMDINYSGKEAYSMLDKVAEFAEKQGCRILIGADSNAHSSLWGCEINNQRGDEMEEWFILNQFAVANVGDTPTFVTSRAQSIIDITLVSNTLLPMISEWRVHTKYNFSDHRRISFKIDFENSVVQWRRNYNKANWQKFQLFLKKAKSMHLPRVWTNCKLEAAVGGL